MRFLIAILLSIFTANAATYYIDYDSGSDANNGTSTSTPWKHCPVMQPFSGSYSHVKGDRFIFKGGVRWPNAALPLYITAGGNTNSYATFDYYGADETWYSGASFTRPIFDGEGQQFQNWLGVWGGNAENVIRMYASGSSGITFDNLCITNWIVTDVSPGGYYDGFAIQAYSSGWIQVTNCWIGHWKVGSAEDGGGAVARSYKPVSWLGPITIHNTYMGGPIDIDPQYVTATGGFTAGSMIYAVQLTENCYIERATQGCWDSDIFRYNIVTNSCHSFQSGVHENGINANGTKVIHNNLFIDLWEGVGTQIMPGWAGGTPRHAWTYNNIFINIPQMAVGGGDTQISPNENEAWFVNNIVVDSYTSLGAKDEPIEGPGVRANNLFINDTKDMVPRNDATTVIKTDFSLPQEINTNNVLLTHAQATALGLLAENFYRPTNRVAILAGQGLDFSGNILGVSSVAPLEFSVGYSNVARPTGAWDIGAWQFDEESGTTGNVSWASSSYSVGESDGTVTNVLRRSGGTNGVITVEYATGDDTATAGSDYTAASGTITFADGQDGDTNIIITITSDGDYEGNEGFTNRLFNVSAGATINAPSNAVVTIVDDDEEVGNPVPLLTSPWTATNMLVEAPFITNAGIVKQTVQTTTPANGGLLRARFTIGSTGNYRISMNVTADDGAKNSVFVEIDEEPTTYDIWDVQSLTTGFEDRYVSIRGNGAFDAPEFPTNQWALSSGEHTLYIRGREANMLLNSITIEAAPADLPADPTGISLLRVWNVVDVSWTDIAGEDGYYVQRSIVDEDNWFTIGTNDANVTTFQDTTGPSPGGIAPRAVVEVYYRVQAFNGQGTGGYTTNAVTEVTGAATSNRRGNKGQPVRGGGTMSKGGPL